MSKRAAIYARVSSDDQRSNYSIGTQVAECVRYVEGKGYALVGSRHVDARTGQDAQPGPGSVAAFVDDFTSREINRPALDAAISFLETAGFDVLVVHALDRLARDPYIRTTLELELGARGATVEYVLGQYEATPEGEVRKDVESAFAKWENLKRVERSRRGKRGKAERGLFVGGTPPFGYRISREAPGGLEVVEHEAAVVRRLFDLFLAPGGSARRVAEQLTAEGVPTPQGGTAWARSTVRRMLGNEAYTGRWAYGRTVRAGAGLAARPRDEWIRVAVPAIVDDATFARAAERLRYNRKQLRRPAQRLYMLGGLVVCEVCGRPYAVQTAKAGRHRRRNDLQSYRHRASEGHCRNRHISARRLDAAVWQGIVGVLLDEANLREGYAEILERFAEARASELARIEALHRARERTVARLDKLTAAYVDPDVGLARDEYLRLRDQARGELASVAAEIEAAEAALASSPAPAALVELEGFAEQVRQALQGDLDPPAELKRAVLQALNARVVIGPGDAFRLEGAFRPVEGLRLSATTPARCARRPPPPPAPS